MACMFRARWEYPHRVRSKRPFSKAAASEGPKACPLGYVEGLSDARTMLADCFCTLLASRQTGLMDG